MATRNRPVFLRQALRYFNRQTYDNSELIVVDDGDEPVEDICRGMPRVRYLRLNTPITVGDKLNLGIRHARGNVIQKLDDDDYYDPGFIACSMSKLGNPAPATAMVAWDCFLVLPASQGFPRFSGHGWTAGGTLCFNKAMWIKKPFQSVWSAEDYYFINDHRPCLIKVVEAERYMLVRHGGNTWNTMSGGSVDDYFGRLPVYNKQLSSLLDPIDLSFYNSLKSEAVKES
jgi:glycosyltransferase involved in cell wall biosynthesis